MIQMMEETRRKLTEWIWNCGQQARLSQPERLAEKAERMIQIVITRGLTFEVRPSDTDPFEVNDRSANCGNRQSFVVNTLKRECSCNIWQNTQIPCQMRQA